MSRYKIVAELGQGGMGVVYRAQHLDLGREVALKLVLGAVKDCEGADVRRFHREVKLSAELTHPNIVRVFDSGEMDGRPYYTMEIVDGCDLYQLVKNGPQPLELVVEVIAQAADALAHIHEKGMVHRDIKPQNIMRRTDGRATVMDFGLARLPTSTVLTREGTLVGTPRYMAPECIKGDEPSQAADVYALALTAHELLAGAGWAPPGLDMRGLAMEILKGRVPCLKGLRENVPEWLLGAQAAALDKNPATRLTAAQYRDALRQPASAPPAPRPSRKTRPVAVTAPPAAPRARPPVLLGVVAALAAAGLAIAFALRAPPPAAESVRGPSATPSPPVTRRAVSPVAAFACYPSERDLRVVFDLTDRSGASVELFRGDEPEARWRRELPSGQLWFTHVFDGLAPLTGYRVRVSAPAARLVDDFRVTTQKPAHANLIEAAVGDFRREPTKAYHFFQLMEYYPDPRAVRVLEDALAAGKLSGAELENAALVAYNVRHARMAELLAPYASAPGAPPLLAARYLEAAGAVVDRRALPLALKTLETGATPESMRGAAYALARLEGPAACEPILRAIARRAVFEAETAPHLAVASPACARELARAWTMARGTTDYALVYAVWRLAEDADVELLASLARRRGPWEEARSRAVKALCEIGSPAALRVLAGVFEEQPAREDLVWAMGYLGHEPAAATLAQQLARDRPASLRRAAACALGLAGGRGAAVQLRAMIGDADASVADAAAWALGQLGDRVATAELLKRATSPGDARGAAAWALGMLGANEAAAPLARVALALVAERTPDRAMAIDTRLAVIAWALGQMQDSSARPALVKLEGPGGIVEMRRIARRALAALDAGKPDGALAVLPLCPIARTGIRLSSGQSVGAETVKLLIANPGSAAKAPHPPELAVFAGYTFRKDEGQPMRVLSAQDAEVVVRPFGECEVDRPTVPLDRIAGLALVTLRR